MSAPLQLRPFQARVVDELEQLVLAGRSPLLVSATGTGKTVMLSSLAERLSARGLGLWTANRVELLGQASDALRDAGLVPEMDVLVRSNQELTMPGVELPPLAWVINDEAHHMAAQAYARLPAMLPGVPMVGATATPERPDGVGLHGLYTDLVMGLDTAAAIAEGYLVPADVIRPERALAPNELAQDPVEAYFAHADGMKAISFHGSVEIAIQTACEFSARGVSAAAVWGEMPAKARADVVARFKRGEVRILTSVAALTEGFDVPDVECVILARGFGSHAGYIQAVGRGLRLAPGKTRCLVLDLRGCFHIHGPPEEPRTYHLEGKGIRRPGEGQDVRWCPVCGAPVTGPECEQCGHAGDMRKRKPRVLGLPLERFARLQGDDDETRARRLARWIAEARSKGWKEGRAMYRYKAVYANEWPSAAVLQRARMMARGRGAA